MFTPHSAEGWITALARCDTFTLWYATPTRLRRTFGLEAPCTIAAPSFFREDTPPGRVIEAKVKWFNASKGFGFVTLSDGSQDAFLPMAILRRAGYEDVREGASITCEVGDRRQGTARHQRPEHRQQHRGRRRATGWTGGRRVPATTLEGAVKWFEPDKGYGFISPDGGGKDVFIHITALRRSGVNALDPGQRVRVEVVDGKKGLEADRITLI